MFYLLKKTWFYAGKDRYKLVICYVLHTLSIIGRLIQPYAFGMVINSLQEYGLDQMNLVYKWLGLYVGGFFVFQIFHHLGRYYEVTTAIHNQKRFNEMAYEKLCNLQLAWHRDHHSGNLLNRIKTGGEAIKEFTYSQSNYMERLLAIVVPFVVFLKMNVAITGITVLLMTMNLYVVIKLNRRIEGILESVHQVYHGYAGRLADYVNNITTIITMGIWKETSRSLANIFRDYYKKQMDEFRINQPRCFLIALGAIMTEITVIVYYLMWHRGTGKIFLIGNLVMLITYFRELSSSIFDLVSNFYDTLNWKTAIRGADLIMKAYRHEKEADSISVEWHRLSIKHMTFRYDTGSMPMVCSDLQFYCGKKIAVVGSSGSGKSTLLHVLANLYEADCVELELDGTSYNHLGIMKKDIGLISQDAEIFDQTILQNITCGLMADEATLLEVLKITALVELVEELPKGLHTPIKEKGLNLSGGQKQRLALARGLYFARKKQILLLDEVTSSVDSVTEMQMMRQMMTYYHDKCIISTVHRLHLLELFDQVLVMEEGKIVERGTFHQLIHQGGHLAQLWQEYQVD